MSRTYKDAPSKVREVRWNGKKVPSDWSEKLSCRVGSWSVVEENWNDLVGVRRWCWLGYVPADFRRDLNRSYRAKTKQAIRVGHFDVDRPRRNAAWLY